LFLSYGLLVSPSQNDPAPDDDLILPHGGYRKLKSFELAELCFDVTVRFCRRYLDKRDRTYDQMVQAARSGSQNIVEGSKVSGTSRKTEMKLTNVARASLEELSRDYRDYLRHRRLPEWSPTDPLRTELIAARCRSVEEVAAWVTEVHGRYGHDGHDRHDGHHAEERRPRRPTHAQIAANTALVLIMVASSLLRRQLASQAKRFLEEGGFTERMYRVRSQHRRQQPRP
jgi:four helix bundle suffix protein